MTTAIIAQEIIVDIDDSNAQGSERPLPPRPRDRDALWSAYETLSTSHAELAKRVDIIEPKLDQVVGDQIATSTNVTAAIERQTEALTSLATSLKSARNVGGWMLAMLVMMFAATVLMAVVVASPFLMRIFG